MPDAGKSVVTKNFQKRMIVTVGIIVCGFCIVILSLTKISLIDHEKLSAAAADQQLRDTVVSAPRGTIYDANMNKLAESAPVWTVALSPMDIKDADREKIATGLSEILGVDRETVLTKCDETNYYSIVKRKVDQPIVDEIRQYMIDNKLNGVSFTEDSKRYYPYGNFASQVLGFVGTDNQGLSGVEAYYDDYLSGTAGRVLTAKNAVGGDMYYEYETTFDPEPGCSLVLTIDEVIQHYLEKSLETAVKVHNVKNKACGIVLNVKTGEILAMSTKPDYDPNSPLEIFDPAVAEMLAGITDSEEYNKQLGLAQQSQWRNKAISDTYEPGSVFKIVTASTALETGAVSLNSTFYCGGSKKVGPHTMYCANHNGHGQETFLQATINSCNPAFIEIGQAIGVKNFCKYFEGFGLTEKTGVDLPGEAISQYIREEHMGIVELSSCSYGQSNSITPLQMITAAAAVVNGGYLVQPHVVKQIIDEDGSIIKSFNGETKRQVISSETSKLMAEIMEQVVLHANGRNAYVSGFRIGGKSGTSQDLGSKIVGKYWASFLGIAPVDDPEIAVLIILDYAQSKDSIYGGILAAPIVGSVMKNVLPYIGIDAVYTEEELGMLDVSVPNVTGRSITSSYAYLQPLGLSATVVGEGTEIVSQFPLAGQSVPRGSSVLLYTDATAPREVKVPDVTGRGQTEATMLFKSVGLNMRASGSGQASGQSVAPGETVAVGTVVTVEFVDHSIAD